MRIHQPNDHGPEARPIGTGRPRRAKSSSASRFPLPASRSIARHNEQRRAVEQLVDRAQALAQRNYYRGAVNGQLDDDTRRALFQFQVDQGLSATGNLDGRTARALGINLGSGVYGGALSGSVLSAAQAAAVRRDAQQLVSRLRSELAASGVARLDPARAYAQGDLNLWFALSAFADNASIYEQIVSNGGNPNAAILAGRALVDAERRVDTALQATSSSTQVQNAWTAIRRQMTTLDASGSSM